MDIDAIRQHCLAFPHATETMQWGADLCFKVDGKLFAVAPLEVAPVRLSFKCTPENFVELCERPGIIPAPYMARARWVALESLNAVGDDELRELIADSYRLVWQCLPKKCREALARTVDPDFRQTPWAAKSKKKKAARKVKRSVTGRRK